jgi:hypothetical protein
METSSVNFDSGQVIFRVLISVSELAQGLILALKLDIVEFWIFNAFVDGPEAIDLFEIIEVHPENTIIARSIKTNLSSKFFCPKWRVIRPVSCPFTTTPWISQLDETDCVSVDIKNFSS